MFGLENQKQEKKKVEEFVFDLEKELKTTKGDALKKQIEAKEQKIKEVLRGGEEKEDFNQFGELLYGYTALKKVMSRASQK